MQIKVGQFYRLVKKIDSGSFGEIYKGLNTKNNTDVAIKLQTVNTKYPQLLAEAKILLYLLSDGTVVDKGIPNIYYNSTEGEYNVLVMELLGPSLQNCFQNLNKKFSLKTTMMLAEQMLRRLEYVHSKGILHRDVKPDNFLMGIGNKSKKLYIIDFGLSKKYTQKDGKHMKYQQGKSLTGTARYASLNTHLGIQPSRRDDIESMLFCIAYFMLGILPWQNQDAKTKDQKYRKIKERKIQNPPQVLCKNLPQELLMMLQTTRQLRFDQKPNYDYYYNLIKQCMARNNLKNDQVFDWQE